MASSKRWLLSLVAAGFVFFVSDAHAEDARVTDAPHRLRFDVGVGSAVGFAGGSYTFSPLSGLHFELGAGFGQSGLLISFMPKVSFGSKRDRFVMGLGAAYATESSNAPAPYEAPFWLTADLAGYEHLADSGLLLSAAVGLTARPDEYGGQTFWVKYPQARIGVGGWFGSSWRSAEPRPTVSDARLSSLDTRGTPSAATAAASASTATAPATYPAPPEAATISAPPTASAAASATSLSPGEEAMIAPARPDPKPQTVPGPVARTRYHRVGVDLGLFSAVGFGGLSYAVKPFEAMMLEAAVGYGLTGYQFSLMPKVRLGSDGLHYVLGIGPSFATTGALADNSVNDWVWINADLLGFERELPSGFSFAGGIGVNVLLWTNKRGEFLPEPGFFFPQLRIGIGHWL